jgi:hypothetical protein
MKFVKKLLESLAQFNGEPNIIAPDESNEVADNYFIINVFNNLLRNLTDTITCVGVEVREGQADVILTDGERETVLTFFDEDGVPYLSVSDLDDADYETEEDEAYEISELGIFDGYDFNFAKLDYRILDYFTDITSEDEEAPESQEVTEAFITVVRGGKKVKKKLKRKKRRKPLSGKRRTAIRQAVRKRKRSQRIALRKRKRSLAIRNRSKLRKKPKNFRV